MIISDFDKMIPDLIGELKYLNHKFPHVTFYCKKCGKKAIEFDVLVTPFVTINGELLYSRIENFVDYKISKTIGKFLEWRTLCCNSCLVDNVNKS